jgi:hypothetical protein
LIWGRKRQGLAKTQSRKENSCGLFMFWASYYYLFINHTSAT